MLDGLVLAKVEDTRMRPFFTRLQADVFAVTTVEDATVGEDVQGVHDAVGLDVRQKIGPLLRSHHRHDDGGLVVPEVGQLAELETDWTSWVHRRTSRSTYASSFAL